MDADDHKVEVVLKEARCFRVPLYQRKYQWDEKRLLPFWEDVSAKAAEVLNGNTKFDHYMGALILAPVETGSQIGITPVVQVVDGQQRLTTFQIFLSALREVARQHNEDDLIEHVDGYLLNAQKSKDTDPLTKFKLTPTPSDRELIHDIIQLESADMDRKYRHLFYGAGVPKNTPERGFRAYFLFRMWIDEFVHYGPQDFEEPVDDDQMELEETDEVSGEHSIGERLEALLKALLDRLKLVVITLGENDDAQVIFETLNSKGEPLLAMDLVRNNIFYRAEKQKVQVEELYNELWGPLDEPWWREPAPNARPIRPRIDHFLAHVLVAESGKKISMRELYAEYRDFAVPKGKPRFEFVEDELKLLEQYAPIYRTLEGVDETGSHALKWLGRKLSTWQVTTIYPVALQIGRDDVDESERLKIASLIYSYIVRRAICALTMKNLNNVFQSLAAHFLNEGISVDSFRTFFNERKESSSSKFPSNQEFHSAVLDENAYRIAPRPRLVDILWELEQASRTKMAEKFSQPRGLWVEHVLPQSWTEEWPYMDGSTGNSSDFDQKSTGRDLMVQVLGNLTLLTSDLNNSISNKSFTVKRKKFTEHTSLFLNKRIAENEQWTEKEIAVRGEHLADLAVKHWEALDDSS